MKVSRSWLQTYFDTPLPSTEKLVELFTFHAFEVEGVEEVAGDTVIDIDVLANRSSDCLSHRGIARELATLLDVPLKKDPLREPFATLPSTDLFSVAVADEKRCDRYAGVLVRGVRIAPSPDWIVARLHALGQKSINNVVDITNLVMFEVGQPLHAFDFAKLAVDEKGKRALAVRGAHTGEHFVSLSKEEYTLAPEHSLIVDAVADTPLALAGIKGGTTAEIDGETTDIVLEAAHFDYRATRKTSRALRLATEASVRFQNDPSPSLVDFALRDACALLEEVAGGSVVGKSEYYQERPLKKAVSVSLARIHTLLGVPLSLAEVERIFARFEWDFSRGEDDVFTISPPWERSDLTNEESLVEEVGRVFGYMNIKGEALPPSVEAPLPNVRHERANALRRILLEAGFDEVYTYTLRAEGDVALVNPLASDKAFLRTHLSAGLAEALVRNARNAPLLGLPLVRIFELGEVFPKGEEKLALALGVAQGTEGNAKRVRAELVEMQKSIEAFLGQTLAWQEGEGVVECVLALTSPVEGFEPPLPWHSEARYEAWSAYPFVLRDLAVWTHAGTEEEQASAVVRAEAPATLVRCDCFDTFSKEGRTSYAWHLVFQSKERTLTDEEVQGALEKINTALRARGWEVR